MRPDELDPTLAIETLAVHAGQEPDELTGAVSPPIYQTSTYRQPKVGQHFTRNAQDLVPRSSRSMIASESPTLLMAS